MMRYNFSKLFLYCITTQFMIDLANFCSNLIQQSSPILQRILFSHVNARAIIRKSDKSQSIEANSVCFIL